MRHGKKRFRVGRTGAHRRAMIANMLKSLILHDRIETTVIKAKELRRFADKAVTLAKENNLAARRRAIALMRISFNPLTSKEARLVKNGNQSFFNEDRKVLNKLFGEIREKYSARIGGYTRIIKKSERIGDAAQRCYIEFL